MRTTRMRTPAPTPRSADWPDSSPEKTRGLEFIAGLIKEIYCENFMCHKKLEIKLGRRINFINGANGSGKSAILAAMQICLGASAKQTHRGNKLGRFRCEKAPTRLRRSWLSS